METSKLHKMAVIRFILSIPFMFALIFFPAGNLMYWQGWIYFFLNSFILLITIVVLWNKITLLEQRINLKKEMQPWDRIYFILSTPMYFISVIISVLDVRFNWFLEVNLIIYIVALIFYIIGQGIFLWAKYVNEFLAPIVCVQPGHRVCKEGPYRWIRHPSYLGGILFVLTGPLILGSYIGIIPQIIASILLLWRTKKEDDFLREKLPGYEEYTGEVKYRLIWGVW